MIQVSQVYRSKNGKSASYSLYDQQVEALELPYQDMFLETSFGKTHLIELGKPDGKPLLVFHRGNTSSAYNLHQFKFLLKDFHTYALDSIGQPGKSAEIVLSPKNLDYGKWAKQVIEQLHFSKMLVLGGSYGAGIITKLIATAPKKIEKAVLLMPAGIKNNLSLSIMPLALSMLQYRLTKNKSYLLKTALQLAAFTDSRDLDQYILPTLADSFDHVHVRAGMPSNISEQLAKKCKAPLLIMAAENDCLFPAHKVLPRAQAIFSNCQTYLLENRGHLCYLTKQEEQQIITFLKMEDLS